MSQHQQRSSLRYRDIRMKTNLLLALALVALAFISSLFGGCDDGDVRVLEPSTPAGVHGKLKGE